MVSFFIQLVMKHAFQGGGSRHNMASDIDDYNPTLDPILDCQTLGQALVNITAGCCMAMGLRYASTCDQSAFRCLVRS
jgi:hypothetical protein